MRKVRMHFDTLSDGQNCRTIGHFLPDRHLHWLADAFAAAAIPGHSSWTSKTLPREQQNRNDPMPAQILPSVHLFKHYAGHPENC
jgi:hypothetical protein